MGVEERKETVGRVQNANHATNQVFETRFVFSFTSLSTSMASSSSSSADPPPPPSVQGYDVSLFIDLPPDIAADTTCSICMAVFRDPVQPACGVHTFCRPCIHTWLSQEKVCPLCRQPSEVTDLKPNLVVESILSKRRVNCKWKANGCVSTFPLSSLQPHLNTGCDHEPIACPYNTSHPNLQRFAQLMHMSLHCESRPHRLVPCPNGCAPVEQQHLQEHVDIHCPLEQIECPYKTKGCFTLFRRSEKNDHMTTFAQQHVQLLDDAIQDLEKKLEEVGRLPPTRSVEPGHLIPNVAERGTACFEFVKTRSVDFFDNYTWRSDLIVGDVVDALYSGIWRLAAVAIRRGPCNYSIECLGLDARSRFDVSTEHQCSKRLHPPTSKSHGVIGYNPIQRYLSVETFVLDTKVEECVAVYRSDPSDYRALYTNKKKRQREEVVPVDVPEPRHRPLLPPPPSRQLNPIAAFLERVSSFSQSSNSGHFLPC